MSFSDLMLAFNIQILTFGQKCLAYHTCNGHRPSSCTSFLCCLTTKSQICLIYFSYAFVVFQTEDVSSGLPQLRFNSPQYTARSQQSGYGLPTTPNLVNAKETITLTFTNPLIVADWPSHISKIQRPFDCFCR